ncbi:hypothetical protein QBC35DRAFT_517776 [Podospora australis]|uniref:Uncharacterized protein n=1 Tax=Podospora australis TaxID=1536484 RepID=A0AAN7AFQ5_9PEZI|nr:hypothetical protein QBC35DRAFT_517776 [Podospora australis]
MEEDISPTSTPSPMTASPSMINTTKPFDPKPDQEEEKLPENLYHTTLTVIDHHSRTCGTTRHPYILGTHTDLSSAKEFALSCLQSSLNYSPADFTTYLPRSSFQGSEEDWPHGPNCLVYALHPCGQEFLIGLYETPNDSRFGPAAGRLGGEGDELHYVLSTKHIYAQDRDQENGGRRKSLMEDRGRGFQTTEIEGCFVPREKALERAREVLRWQKERGEFAQYDEREEFFSRVDWEEGKKGGTGKEEGSWPFGDEVVVHAVGQRGENFEVAIKTVSAARRRRSKCVF